MEVGNLDSGVDGLSFCVCATEARLSAEGMVEDLGFPAATRVTLDHLSSVPKQLLRSCDRWMTAFATSEKVALTGDAQLTAVPQV